MHAREEVFLELLNDFVPLGDSFCNDFLHNFFNLSHFHSDMFGDLFDVGAHLNNEESVNKCNKAGFIAPSYKPNEWKILVCF